MSYSGGPENLTNSHTDEFNYPIYGINAGTSFITNGPGSFGANGTDGGSGNASASTTHFESAPAVAGGRDSASKEISMLARST